jgi:hypothetical protein
LSSYQVEIVLDEISFEGIQRKTPVSHGHYERMSDVLIPDWSYFGPLEQVFDEPVSSKPIIISSSQV